jgi:putative glycosyltransferase (TIGR04348 family)
LAKPHITIISPALAKANNGNWQTANRWARFLRQQYHVSLASEWDGAPAEVLIALHARRSAASIAAFAAAGPDRPLILVLTGTDLYRDVKTDTDAQRSLQLASRLVVLQSEGLQGLRPELRRKASVIYQSAPALTPIVKNFPARHFKVSMVGHLREEKDPATFMQAAALVTSRNVRLVHIGAALDPLLGEHAESTQRACPHYHWLGNVAHARTRQLLKRSHLMAIASKMEGGANVIIEAITSGVPVLASDIPGNRGMLGVNYSGYFPVGGSRALAGLIDRSITDTAFYTQLQAQCAARAALFSPQREKAALLQLVDNVFN